MSALIPLLAWQQGLQRGNPWTVQASCNLAQGCLPLLDVVLMLCSARGRMQQVRAWDGQQICCLSQGCSLVAGLVRVQNEMWRVCGWAVLASVLDRGWLLGLSLEEGQWVWGVCLGRGQACGLDQGCLLTYNARSLVMVLLRERVWVGCGCVWTDQLCDLTQSWALMMGPAWVQTSSGEGWVVMCW